MSPLRDSDCPAAATADGHRGGGWRTLCATDTVNDVGFQATTSFLPVNQPD